MRPRSLIGPLILVLIGVLFLVHNLRPDLVSFEKVARYWPLVLIAWGLLRLAEIAVWAILSKPVPARGISSGEWVLVIFICLIGSGFFLAYRHMPQFPFGRINVRGVEVFGEPYDYPLAAEAPAGKTPRVVIDNLRGNTRIIGGDVDRIKVTGRKTVRALNKQDADAADKLTPLEIVAQDAQIVIRTNQERVSDDRQVSADLEITVPRGASIEGHGRGADYDITGIEGSIDMNCERADLRLQDVKGNVRAELRRSDLVRAVNVKGTIELTGRGRDVELQGVEGQVTVNGAYSGDLQFRNLSKPVHFLSTQTELRVAKVPGTMEIDLREIKGNNLVGPIQLTTRSRDIQIGDFTDTLDITVERGDIQIQPKKLPLAKIDARTRSGNIEVSLPAAAKFEVDATTPRGEVNNEFGPGIKADNEGRGGSLKGAVGTGPKITLSTERGSITLRKE